MTAVADHSAITPYLIVKDAAAAIEFYRQAFGAMLPMAPMTGPNGEIVHAEMSIGNASVMLADEQPGMGNRSPLALGGSPVTLLLKVGDVDDVFQRAVKAGATVLRQPADQFYGDRTANVTDPYGHVWLLSTHVEDVSPEEMNARLQKLFNGASGDSA